MAGNKYFRNTGDTNWGTGSNWSATDGGASIGAIPGFNDTIFFTANSGDCNIAANTNSLSSLNTTGYNGTITLAPNVNLKIGAVGIVLGSGTKLVMGANAWLNSDNGNSTAVFSITSNGVFIPYFNISAVNNMNITIVDSFNTSFISSGSFSNVTWSGVGFRTGDYLSRSMGNGVVYTFAAGSTYTVYNMFRFMFESDSAHTTVRSSVAGTRAYINVTGDAIVANTNFTDIDASGGRTIYTLNGVVTNCVNIVAYSDYIAPPNTTVSSIVI